MHGGGGALDALLARRYQPTATSQARDVAGMGQSLRDLVRNLAVLVHVRFRMFGRPI
jgi:hypothetical protein